LILLLYMDMNGLLIISYKDIADMWIHEFHQLLWKSFCGILLERSWFWIRKRNQEKNIQNDKIIIGHYNVNKARVICTIRGKYAAYLRQIVNDDEKWRTILRGLNSTFIIRRLHKDWRLFE
jgi:hypothetical protein